MSNLDPRLALRLAAAQSPPPGNMAALAARATDATSSADTVDDEAAGGETINVFVHFTGPLEDLLEAGLQAPAVAPDPAGVEPTIAAGSIELSRLAALSDVPHVVWIDPSNPVRPMLDVSVESIGAKSLHERTPPWTGKGVVVGVIDSGFRYDHWTFRNPKNLSKSRIAYFWDQQPNGYTDTARTYPPEYKNIGLEYEAKDLEALMAAPRKQLWAFHGTHVAGIAAGNGLVPNPKDPSAPPEPKYAGVAPEATLVVVKARTADGVSDDVGVIQGIEYIFRRADGMPRENGGTGLPCVVNLSLGDLIGPHDGTAPVEKMIDRMVSAKAGRVVVVAAGNERQTRRHAIGSIERGGSGKVKIDMGGPRDTRLDLWYSAPNVLRVKVTAPKSRASDERTESVWVSPGPTVIFEAIPAGSDPKPTEVRITSYATHRWNNQARILVEMIAPEGRDGLPDGTWELLLEDATPADVSASGPIQWEAWSAEYPFIEHCPWGMLAIPGTARNAITVGAYTARPGHPQNYEEEVEGHHDAEPAVRKCGGMPIPSNPDDQDPEPRPADFSNYGPVRGNGYHKPDITAPGVGVMSADGYDVVVRERSSCCEEEETSAPYIEKRGTSMAAPHVAGVVALMLQKNPTLTFAEVHEYLTKNADKPDEKLTLPDFRWGYGKVNAVRALDAVPAPPSTPSSPTAPTDSADLSLAAPAVSSETADAAPDPTAWARTPARPRALPRAELRALRDALQLTPRGRALLRLVSEHADEVRRLVNQHRRVAVAWHRAGGPGLVQGVLDAVEDRSRPLPAEAAGLPLAEALEPVLHAFRKHGSPALAAAVDRHAADLLALSGAPLDEVLEGMHAAATGG